MSEKTVKKDSSTIVAAIITTIGVIIAAYLTGPCSAGKESASGNVLIQQMPYDEPSKYPTKTPHQKRSAPEERVRHSEMSPVKPNIVKTEDTDTTSVALPAVQTQSNPKPAIPPETVAIRISSKIEYSTNKYTINDDPIVLGALNKKYIVNVGEPVTIRKNGKVVATQKFEKDGIFYLTDIQDEL